MSITASPRAMFDALASARAGPGAFEATSSLVASLLSPDAAGPRAMRRAATWLHQHGFAGTPPTPLIAARLVVRRRVSIALIAAIAAAAAYLVQAPSNGWWGPSSPVAFYVVVVLLGAPIHWLVQRAAVMAERRIGATLARRVAHPTPPDWQVAIGRWRLIASIAVHAVAFGTGIAVAALATNAADRTKGLVLIAVVVLGAATAAVEVAVVLRRPALADDTISLAVDDALRAEDARQLVASPFPAIVAAFTIISLTPALAASLRSAAYFFLLAAAAATIWSSADPRPRPATARRPTVPVG